MLGQLATIWRYRYFWTSLVKMDIQVRYRRSYLGIGWSLLHPILMTVVFCVIFAKWMLTPGGESSWRFHAPHVLAGLAIWEFISAAALGGCFTFFRNEAYIRQCPLPLPIYALRTVLGAGVHFAIAMGVVIVAASVLHPTHPLQALKVLWAVIPSLVLLLIFCISIAIIFGFVAVFFQDTQQLLEVLFKLFFFLSPIMYTNQFLVENGHSWLIHISPVVMFFDLIRAPLLTGELPTAWLFFKSCVVVLFVLGVAVAMVAWLEKKLIFRL